MKYKALAGLIALLGATAGAVWLRERRAKTVFPARQAALLLQPARRLVHRPEQMVAAFGIRPGHRVLELGPGPGYFTPAAARVVGGSGLLVAADLQPAMLDILTKRLTPGVASRTRTVACDATRLPFGDASFDAAFLVTVLGEIPEPVQALFELRRVLLPRGTLSIAEHIGDPDYVREGTLRRLCAEAGLEFIDRQRQPLGYIARFTAPPASTL